MRLAATLLFVASAAAAEPEASHSPAAVENSSFSFEWNAPASCPARADVLERAERLVGHTLTRAAGGQPVGLVATVQPLANQTWQLDVLSGSRAESKRSVTASSCDELGDAMALLIALSIDPDYAARQGSAHAPEGQATFADASPPAPPAPSNSGSSSGSKEPEAPVVVLPVPSVIGPMEPSRAPSSPRSRLDLAALGAVWVGRLPGTAPGGALRGALSLEHWALGVELGFFPEQHAVNGALGANLWLATLGGSFGYVMFNDVLTPYIGLELDLLHGTGTGLTNPQSDAVWLLGLDAGLRSSYPVYESVRVVASGQLSVLPQEGRFHVDPNTELFRPDRVGAEVGLGAELRVR